MNLFHLKSVTDLVQTLINYPNGYCQHADRSRRTNRYYSVPLKKRHPFYFRDIFAGCYQILPIFGRNIPEGI